MRSTLRTGVAVCTLLLSLALAPLTGCADRIEVSSADSSDTIPSQQQTGADDGTLTSDDSGSSPGTNVETGTCTASDLTQDTSADDLDRDTSRDIAVSEVEQVLPAADEVVISEPAWDEIPTLVVQVEAGSRSVRIDASGLTVVIEGDIETLTVNGTVNTVWVNGVGTVDFGPEASLNYVFWAGETAPAAGAMDQGWNTIARDEFAVHVRYYCA